MVDTVQDNLHNTGFIKEAGLRNIAQQAAEGDVGQQQRFETFADSQVEQNQAYQEHDYVTAGQPLETGVVPYGLERYNQSFHI